MTGGGSSPANQDVAYFERFFLTGVETDLDVSFGPDGSGPAEARTNDTSKFRRHANIAIFRNRLDFGRKGSDQMLQGRYSQIANQDYSFQSRSLMQRVRI
jgi:hypothetical protein